MRLNMLFEEKGESTVERMCIKVCLAAKGTWNGAWLQGGVASSWREDSIMLKTE